MAEQQNKVPPRKAASARSRSGGPARNRPTKRGSRGFPRKYLYSGAGVVVIAVIVVIALISSGGSSSGVNRHQAAIDYSLTSGSKVYGGLGPENVPLETGPQLAPANAGLTGATIDGIQCSSTEQLVYHHHVHLALFVNGKPYSVPLGVGMVPTVQVSQTPQGPFADGSTKCLYWMHVHAQDGIIHIESPEVRNFQLGQFMDIWHVPLTSTKLGSFTGKVTATVNGVPWSGDLRQIPLTEHAQIVVNLGAPVVTPPPISWTGTGL